MMLYRKRPATASCRMISERYSSLSRSDFPDKATVRAVGRWATVAGGLVRCAAPDKMKNLHMHHIVREMAPKNWSKKDRGAIYHVQNLAKKYGMTDLNRDPRNFYWARNGGGAYTKKTIHYIRDQLAAASKVGGKDGFFDNIRELGLDAEQGIFNR